MYYIVPILTACIFYYYSIIPQQYVGILGVISMFALGVTYFVDLGTRYVLIDAESKESKELFQEMLFDLHLRNLKNNYRVISIYVVLLFIIIPALQTEIIELVFYIAGLVSSWSYLSYVQQTYDKRLMNLEEFKDE